MDLQPHLAQAAYQLPSNPSSSHLFGEGIMEILGLEEDYASKKQTRQLNQAVLRHLSSKGGARPKQPQFQGQRCRGGPI